jgi:aminoglycoside phosphotransferase (APT) family kinase protein
LFVKAKPADTHTIDVARALARLASPALGNAVEMFRDHLGFTRGPARELAIYAMTDERLRSHVPSVVHAEHDEAAQRWVLALEWIDDAMLMNATDPGLWSDDAIDAALVGLAEIHAVWFGRERELSAQPWMGPGRDARRRERMTPLWSALMEHACAHSAPWRDAGLRRIHGMLIAEVRGWAAALDSQPMTLVHNDFNPRNIAMRRSNAGLRLCAFDWELATLGAPQRDLVEFLCFVLPSDAAAAAVRGWSERYRALLSNDTRTGIERATWDAGMRAALADVLVDRLASYAMIDRVRPQRFLTYVTESWRNLHSVFPWNG